MTSAVDVAWAAGLFEGEGCATISTGGQRQPRVSVQMTDEDVVRRFHSIVACGNVRRYHYPPRRLAWQWSVQGGADVLHVLGMLYPHLGARRQERAVEVIERAAKIGEEDGYCKRGHDLSDARHLYLHLKSGKRHCRTCRSENAKRRWALRLGN